MKIGVFDHLDKRDEPLGKFYEDRLAYTRALDEAGFYSYHIAEHHATPLGMAPSPNVYLAAVARETKRLRFGPLVYLLPLYHPVRLIEEIAMLDNLSNGRLDMGVGRGISPYEVGSYDLDPANTRAMFEEGLEILLAGLTHERLDHRGEWYRVDNVPIELHPVQKPFPPLWYGAGNAEGAIVAARYGMHIVTLGDNERCRNLIARYREMWEEEKDDPRRAAAPAEPLIGMGRHIFLAETDAEAEKLAARAYRHWYDALAKLWRDHGGNPVTGMIMDNYAEARSKGQCVIGTPDTVRAELTAQIPDIGNNYLVCQIAWGDLGHEREMRSLRLFVDEVMPAIAAL
jgi:alkanesulfonate monooxygenase SsuD/methylene tetrahydromethanopterin reductase-like flavin-dependent oxidoreductase (luciferase family)